jgi:hypothetical protein
MFTVENHGSIFLVQPLTADVRDWLDSNTEGMWYGGALVVEHRYIEALVAGMVEEGFVKT